MVDIFMICPLSSQPRIIKRATHLNDLCKLQVYGFQRKVYEQNTFPSYIPYQSLGYINDAKYLSRVFTLLKALFFIRKRVNKNTVFYALSIDCLLLAKLAGIKKGLYEIGDLRSCEKPESLSSKLERFFIRRLGGIVITSDYFYSEYFRHYKSTKDSKFYVIKNKLHPDILNSSRELKGVVSGNKIKIGLIGLLRYEKPIRWLINFVKNHQDKYELHCYGDGPLRSLIEHNQNKSIYNYGSFKSPEDLTEIYKNIDLNFVVYDNKSKNVQLALPNKLYESIYFCVPILAAENTSLAKEVQKLGVGECVSLCSEKKFGADIKQLSIEKIKAFSQTASKIDSNFLIDDSKKKLQNLLTTIDSH